MPMPESPRGPLGPSNPRSPYMKKICVVNCKDTAVLSEVTRDTVYSVMKHKMRRTRKWLLDLFSRIPREVIFSSQLALQLEIADERAEQASFYVSAHLDCLRSCPASPQINSKTTTDLNVCRAEFCN